MESYKLSELAPRIRACADLVKTLERIDSDPERGDPVDWHEADDEARDIVCTLARDLEE
jgi:hypothetical protein